MTATQSLRAAPTREDRSHQENSRIEILPRCCKWTFGSIYTGLCLFLTVGKHIALKSTNVIFVPILIAWPNAVMWRAADENVLEWELEDLLWVFRLLLERDFYDFTKSTFFVRIMSVMLSDSFFRKALLHTGVPECQQWRLKKNMARTGVRTQEMTVLCLWCFYSRALLFLQSWDRTLWLSVSCKWTWGSVSNGLRARAGKNTALNSAVITEWTGKGLLFAIDPQHATHPTQNDGLWVGVQSGVPLLM